MIVLYPNFFHTFSWYITFSVSKYVSDYFALFIGFLHFYFERFYVACLLLDTFQSFVSFFPAVSIFSYCHLTSAANRKKDKKRREKNHSTSTPLNSLYLVYPRFSSPLKIGLSFWSVQYLGRLQDFVAFTRLRDGTQIFETMR